MCIKGPDLNLLLNHRAFKHEVQGGLGHQTWPWHSVPFGRGILSSAQGTDGLDETPYGQN